MADKASIPTITRDMIIGDIVGLYPEAADVMMSYGIHCVGCHANAFETLEQGLLGHGFTEEVLEDLVKELNEYAEDYTDGGSEQKPLPPEADEMEVCLTENAIKKIQEIAKAEEKSELPLKIEVRSVGIEFKYSMNFIQENEKDKHDKLFTFADGKVKILLDKRDHKKIHGLEIDYLVEEEREGFKMNNPNQKTLN